MKIGILLLLVPTIYAMESPLLLRAYQLLGLEEDEQTTANAKQLYNVLRKNPRYSAQSYYEPHVRALVMRIHKDLDDAWSVIQNKNTITSLPSVSPLDDEYRSAVHTFLDLVGAYTRVIESGQNESTIKEKSQALYNFMEGDAYKTKVALFLPEKPIFDFSLLLPTQPLSFSELVGTLSVLQNKALVLHNALNYL